MSTSKSKTKTSLTPPESLEAWRRDRGLSQMEAADALGISQTHYSRLERGAATPRRELLKQIAKRTGVPLESLVGIAS